MSRIFGALFALALVAPTSAFACGMYIPEPSETKPTLAAVLDSIDEAVKPADVKPEVANAQAATVTVVAAEEPADSNTRHAKRHKHSDS